MALNKEARWYKVVDWMLGEGFYLWYIPALTALYVWLALTTSAKFAWLFIIAIGAFAMLALFIEHTHGKHRVFEAEIRQLDKSIDAIETAREAMTLQDRIIESQKLEIAALRAGRSIPPERDRS